jgi:hypothetical protein
MTEGHAELRGAVALANQAIAAAGLVVHAFGNASQVDRDRGVFAIKPSGIPCRETTGDDIVVVSLDDGEVVWGGKRPSSDTPTHRAIYTASSRSAVSSTPTPSMPPPGPRPGYRSRVSAPPMPTTSTARSRSPVP